MCRFFTVRKLLLAAVVAAAGTVSTQAHAGGYGYGGGYHQNWAWKTVIVYETIEKPVVHYVTKYDHYGTPHQVKVVSDKTIRVPVEKQVKVYY